MISVLQSPLCFTNVTITCALASARAKAIKPKCFWNPENDFSTLNSNEPFLGDLLLFRENFPLDCLMFLNYKRNACLFYNKWNKYENIGSKTSSFSWLHSPHPPILPTPIPISNRNFFFVFSKATKKLLGMMDVFIILIDSFTDVCTCLMYQIVHFKYVRLSICQWYLSKAGVFLF